MNRKMQFIAAALLVSSIAAGTAFAQSAPMNQYDSNHNSTGYDTTDSEFYEFTPINGVDTNSNNSLRGHHANNDNDGWFGSRHGSGRHGNRDNDGFFSFLGFHR